MVSVFAAIIGILFTRMPYISQSVTPAEKIPNIPSERSFADFDFQVLITCGRKEMEVSAPAISPSVSVESISFICRPKIQRKVSILHNQSQNLKQLG